MRLVTNKSKIIFIGIIFILLNTLSGSSFDAIAKFLSSSSLVWYHYFSLGNVFALIIFFVYLFFTSGIKKNIYFRNKKLYFLPIARGIVFIPIPIIVYYVLKFINLNIYTTILMTTPFFVYIFSALLQKEKISLKFWLILLFGFFGTIFVIKPSFSETNLLILLVFLVAIHNSLTNVIVSKYASGASANGYTLFQILPLTLLSCILFFINPITLNLKEVILICSGGFFVFLSIFSWTIAFHLAGKYSSIISPFIFCQIIWASLYGSFFYNENLDFVSIFGIILIIISGTLIIVNTPVLINNKKIEN